jgi:hypothetical protein
LRWFLSSILADTEGEWVFSNRQFLKWSAQSPFLLYADAEHSEANSSFIRDETQRIRALINLAGYHPTRENGFELIIRHFVTIK